MKTTNLLLPNYIFATSWEVCNKIGGIYTVLSTQAKTLQQDFKDHLFYIGPDIWKDKKSPSFLEDTTLLKEWREKFSADCMPVRIGRWNVPGYPIVFLVDYTPLYNYKDTIYAKMWEDFKVDSLHAYGDYDESCMFSLAAGKLAEYICTHFLKRTDRIVFQAHEWMSGCGLLYIKKHCPWIGSIFTTHATSIGRSITTNNKPLYDYFDGYNGDQMATELHMEAKHSIEKLAALNADCLTTVSHATDKECLHFFGRASDVILMNGFEEDFIPKGSVFQLKRQKARKTILNVANNLMGTNMDSASTVILSTSGRNDYRCKGYDILMDAFSIMQRQDLNCDILAMYAVPCWKKGPREDLIASLRNPISHGASHSPLPYPFITHNLYNFDDDQIINALRAYNIRTSGGNRFHVMLVPSYLDGKDGIFNLSYYDWLIGNDFCLYPSYYEPWGYTCLESVAFGIPCLTTDLSGFGQWVNHLLGHTGSLKEGVAVVHRTDSNFEQAAQDIADNILSFLSLTPQQRKECNHHASVIAHKALWKTFIKNYYKAFSFALDKATHNINR